MTWDEQIACRQDLIEVLEKYPNIRPEQFKTLRGWEWPTPSREDIKNALPRKSGFNNIRDIERTDIVVILFAFVAVPVCYVFGSEIGTIVNTGFTTGLSLFSVLSSLLGSPAGCMGLLFMAISCWSIGEIKDVRSK